MTSLDPSRFALLCFACIGFRALAAPDPSLGTFPVDIQVQADQPTGAVNPIWRFFGADEPNYATMKDGQTLVGELGALRPGSVFFRTHNLLNTGDGTAAFKWGSTNAYTEDKEGRPVYDWTILDRLFDTYLSRGVRPYAQIGFMPEALSVHPEPYRHAWRPGFSYSLISAGWAYPPRDYQRWADLVYHWVSHCVERYGRSEVERWYWEVWNEPNGAAYWHGSAEDFYKLHDYAVDAVRRALPSARVGGPDVAGSGGAFMEGFLRHITEGTNYATGKRGTPADFVSFHAKGSPQFVDGHVQMGIAAQLSTIATGFRMISAVPALRGKPIVIGESDPEGCAACQGPRNGYRNGTMYSSYTAAVFARTQLLADRYAVTLDGALTWAFEFEDQPYFAGFRALATNGIDLPVLNVFRMMSQMTGHTLAARSSAEVALDDITSHGVRGQPDVGVVACRDATHVRILVWHYHDDDVAGPDALVTLRVTGLGTVSRLRLTHQRVDEDHSNAYAAWKRAGSPQAPDEGLYGRIRESGRLAALESGTPRTVSAGTCTVIFPLPRQGVSLVSLELQGPTP